MSDQRRFHLYGEKKAGVHNKYYEVEAIELEDGSATWEFRWARIGSICGRPKSGASYSFATARNICQAQFDKKCAKGYQEVSALVALASAAEEPSERANRGLENVTLDVLNFQAGPSEARLRKFCTKYNEKLNVIRASFNVLGYDAYRKQIETMLKQYCAEFERIQSSKTHGPWLVSFAVTAGKEFFNRLRENAGCTVWEYFGGVGSGI